MPNRRNVSTLPDLPPKDNGDVFEKPSYRNQTCLELVQKSTFDYF
jgi:hypothetical protein